MASHKALRGVIPHLLKVLTLALLVLTVVLSGKVASFFNIQALAFIIVGGIATALISFSGAEIRAALAHAAGIPGSAKETYRSVLFWEASARNFWILGVLGSILHFVVALGNTQGGLPGIATAMALSLLATFYGMVLAVVCYIPFWRLAGELRIPPVQGLPDGLDPSGRGRVTTFGLGNIAGYALFVAALLSALAKRPLSESWAVLQWIIYWPSLLVVAGGTLLLVLFVGKSSFAPTITMSFAVTGMIGSLLGFIQALYGIASASIVEVSAAITFVLSSCFSALLGMLLVGAPLEDRRTGTGRQSVLSRVAWYVFPMAAFILLVLMFVLVITPLQKPE